MKSFAWQFFLIILITSCQQETKQETSMKQDAHSFSRPDQARGTHLTWKATVDFQSKTISATATWTIETNNDAQEVIFDTKGLTIEKVSNNEGQDVQFKLGETDPILGQSLTVNVDKNIRSVSISYRTNPDAEALQWLAPSPRRP